MKKLKAKTGVANHHNSPEVNTTIQKTQPFLEDLMRWAETQHDLLALALVGSHARGAARADSDVDLVLIARDPAVYLHDTGWAQQFGDVTRQQLEDYGRLTSLRVWYAGGLEVEFGLTDPIWAARPLDAGTRRVISDGMRVLWERKPILSVILSNPGGKGAL